MNEKLYINGFLVKSLRDDPHKMFPPENKQYRGVGRFVSWPLDDCGDDVSKALEREAWDKWFGRMNVIEVVPEQDYLRRYIAHCNALGIETMIMMVETPLSHQIAVDSLRVVECLGFDSTDNVQFSHLTIDTDIFYGEWAEEDKDCVALKTIFERLNANGLCDSMSDIYEHIAIRNDLLAKGVNLELGEPMPVRLSIVALD